MRVKEHRLEPEMGEVVELLRASLDLFFREAADAVEAEMLDGEATHDGAVDHGAAEGRVVDGSGSGERAHEAAGKAVAGAGGVADDAQRHGRGGKNRLAAEKRGAMLA